MNRAHKDVVILGASAHALDALDAIDAIHAQAGEQFYSVVAFLDDDPTRHGTEFHGHPIDGPLSRASRYAGAWFINAIGSVRNFRRRDAIVTTAGVPHDRFATIIHPSAAVSPRASVGFGSVILPHVTICADSVVGNHALLLPGVVINHHVRVADFVCVSAGACLSGGVTVGSCSYIGSNAAIRGGVSIGARALVGMGSTVLENVADDSIVAGNPARRLEISDTGATE